MSKRRKRHSPELSTLALAGLGISGLPEAFWQRLKNCDERPAAEIDFGR